MLFRCFCTNNKNALLRAFKAYVMPIVEYCSPVWNPTLLKNVDLLENVQRYFTRRLFARCHMPPVSYPERLKILDMKSLQERRLQNDLVMCYNIIHNEVELNTETFFTRAITTRTKSNHSLKLYVRRTAKQVFSSFFSNRIVPIWNALPSHIDKAPLVTAQNVKLFRQRLSKLFSQNPEFLSQYLTFNRHM